jgi:hypothetical protein
MRLLQVCGLFALALIITACPSAQQVQEIKRIDETSEYEDAVRIKSEAASKYLRLSSSGASRDGKTLRGVVEGVSVIENTRENRYDTVWMFRDLVGATVSPERIAIPLSDIELLPSLFQGMVTDEKRGVNLVESFHVTKNIPQIRELPITLYDCERFVPKPKVEPPCDCEPFVLGLDLDLSCADRRYGRIALAGLLRGSAFTDGVSPATQGKLGGGLDAFVGWRFGQEKRWVVGVTLSTGIATINAGEIPQSAASIADMAVTLRPLALATARYYFTPLLPPKKREPIPDLSPFTALDTVPHFISGQRLPCVTKSSSDSMTTERDATTIANDATLAGSVEQKRDSVVTIETMFDPCQDVRVRYERLVRWQEVTLRRDTVYAPPPDPVTELFGGCIKPYVYGEAGMAFDPRTRAALAMALDLTCNDCVAALREANLDGSLGLNWSLPLTFGFGAGLDIPVSSKLDLEIDLGYRNIAVGDAYRILGYANVPDTRRISQFQLRIGVMY